MKRWALIQGGTVANVVEQDDQPQIGGTWVQTVSAGPGWTYQNGVFEPPVVLEPVAVVTRRQALRALHSAGLLASVESAINALPEPQKTTARIDWDNATEFRRDFPLLISLASALGLTAADIDDLFAAAAAIQ